MQYIKIEFYTEDCCELCNEVIHNHMKCPACLNEYAGTSMYHDIFDLEINESMYCEECKAEFKLINKSGYISEYEWERIK